MFDFNLKIYYQPLHLTLILVFKKLIIEEEINYLITMQLTNKIKN
jgi:hypothetical protein